MNTDWRENLTSALKALDDAGIGVFAEGRTVIFDIPVVEQVVIRTTDQDVVQAIMDDWHKGVAAYYGVLVVHLKKWMEAKRDYPQCTANTRAGRRCKSYAWSKEYRVPNNPAEWNSEAPVYCPIHDGGVR